MTASAEGSAPATCAYVFADGSACTGEAPSEGGLCFWHDPKAPKDGPEIRQQLESWARSGRSMEGFVLRQARLEGARLSSQDGFDLRGADLSRANLNHARLENAELLGAMLEGAKLEEVKWGAVVLQETRADAAIAAGTTEEGERLYKEAEEVYRNLRRTYDASGYFQDAGRFFYRVMVMRRKLLPRWSMARAWSKLVDLACGYGESPPRVILFSSLVVFGAAFFYFLLGVQTSDGFLIANPQAGIAENVNRYLTCLYFSVVTFCTIGYGDVLPQGYARAVAVSEGFIGAFSMALFILVFSKKMTRS